MKKSTTRINKKIIITLLVMLILILFSGIISMKISNMEEEACWDTLHGSMDEVSEQMESMVKSDQMILESIADIIAAHDAVDSSEIQDIIDGFRPNTMISHIALLLPGDKVMLPGEPMRDTGDLMSFEEEAALGYHISDRSVDIRDESRMILRNFVPVMKNDEVIAMLYGVVDLQTLPQHLNITAYGKEAAIYIIDGKTEKFIVDTWHDTLGNLSDLGVRNVKKGYSQEKLHQDVIDRNPGHCVFVSNSTGEELYFYYEPIEINYWLVGISVSESLAFAGLKKVNSMLWKFIVFEIIVLAGYFIYILLSTRKELSEKQRLAERDLLTGLLNRNSFESSLDKYSETCKYSLACIYIDANGLHELNNTKGHAAGDNMLKTVANAVHDRFNDRDVYRIGGDEFVAFVRDAETENIHMKLEEISQYLTEHGYHISVGMCQQSHPIDMDTLIKKAEKSMYENKKLYYEQKGVDRRTRT